MDTPSLSQLDLLRPLAPPDHGISAWPLAAGWWILLGFCCAAIATYLLLKPWLKRRRADQQIRLHTRSLLDALYQECQHISPAPVATQRYLQHSNEIFKRVIHLHPSLASAWPLTGSAWCAFLAKVDAKQTELFAPLYGDALYAAQCTRTIDLESLHHWACDWSLAVQRQASHLAKQPGNTP